MDPTNPVSELKPDEAGYYNVVLSHFNRPNHNGQVFLPLSDLSVKKLNDRGFIMGEVGQPRRLPGETIQLFLQRIQSVDPEHVAFLLKDVATRTIYDEHGLDGKVQEVTGRITPYGSRASVLKDLLAQEGGHLFFGLCALTNEKPGKPGITEIQQVISWNLIPNNPHP